MPFLLHSKKALYTLLLFGALLLFPGIGNAAVLSLSPDTESTGVGGEVVVQVVIDSEGDEINAAEAVVRFPTSIFDVVELDDSDSIFNFWVEEPVYSNEDGTIRFTGGTPQGVSGEELSVVRIVFEARGAGNAELSIADAVVTAADGRGTNVLRTVQGAAIGVDTQVVQPAPQEPVAEAPEVVTRQATQASALPEAPTVRVPLYPDPERWYDHTGETAVLWDVPDDVTAVAFALDQNPNTIPQTAKENLVTGEEIGTLEEGVHYAHVQFRNNIGWGETRHYRIAIDTTPPIAFDLELSNDASENPSPEISFETQDALSGIARARIAVDDQDPFVATSTSFILPPQAPGEHVVSVRVFDHAGNSIERSAPFEILPIEQPSVDFLTSTVEQGEAVFASGTALPNVAIEAVVRRDEGQEAWRGEARSNDSGDWKLTIEETFARGKYTLSVFARDERGAQSFPTEAQRFTVRAQTIFAIGGIALGWFEILVFVVLLIAAAGGYGAWWYARSKETRSAYHTVVGRDIDKMALLMGEQIDLLARWQEREENNLTPQAREEAAHALDKLRTLVSKTQRYIKKEIDPLK